MDSHFVPASLDCVRRQAGSQYSCSGTIPLSTVRPKCGLWYIDVFERAYGSLIYPFMHSFIPLLVIWKINE